MSKTDLDVVDRNIHNGDYLPTVEETQVTYKLLTVEDISTIQRIGRDEENRRTSIGLTEFDALCATARAGMLLVSMLRGYLQAGDRGDGEFDRRTDDALRQMMKAAGFRP